MRTFDYTRADHGYGLHTTRTRTTYSADVGLWPFWCRLSASGVLLQRYGFLSVEIPAYYRMDEIDLVGMIRETPGFKFVANSRSLELSYSKVEENPFETLLAPPT